MNEIQFLLYNTPNENIKVNVIVKDETLWLTQKAMAELFDCSVSSISRHLKNIFAEGELEEKVVIAKIANTTQHGAMHDKTQTHETKFYNLDAIISVGYRRYYFCRLPCKFAKGNAVPHLGNADFKGIYQKRLRA